MSDGQFAGTWTDRIFGPHILGNQSDKGIKKKQNPSSSALGERERDGIEAKLRAQRLLWGQSLSRFRSRLTQTSNITASRLPTASAIPQAKLFSLAYIIACSEEDAGAVLGFTCPNDPVSRVACN